MKRVPFSAAAVVALLLLTSSMGIAQFSTPNLVGLYMTPDGMGQTGTHDIGLPVNVYLVLTRPEDSGGSPYFGITAFDCQLNFHPIGGIFIIEETFPAGGVNSGDADHLVDGFLEYIVEYSNEVPVVDQAVMFVQLQIINLNIDTIAVTLGPVSTPSILGEMSYLPSSGPLEIMEPSDWYGGGVVFYFGSSPDPVENSPFGSVKALFR